MTRWHHLDPPHLAQACDDAGALVAKRILCLDELVESLCVAAAQHNCRTLPRGDRGDMGGLRTRIAWAVRESADAWDIRRHQAEWAIWRGIGPLLEARAPAAEILAEAERINTDAGSPLLRSEAAEVVKEAMRAELRRAARQRGRRHA